MQPMTTTTEDAPGDEKSDSTESAKRSRRRLMSRVSIQSKLLVMLLLTSVLSAAVVGAIGYQSGRNSLRTSVFERLTEIRQSQTRQLQSGITDLKNSLVIYSRGSTASQAIEAFTAGFDQLQVQRLKKRKLHLRDRISYIEDQLTPDIIA